jgi:hypothetical protein
MQIAFIKNNTQEIYDSKRRDISANIENGRKVILWNLKIFHRK